MTGRVQASLLLRTTSRGHASKASTSAPAVAPHPMIATRQAAVADALSWKRSIGDPSYGSRSKATPVFVTGQSDRPFPLNPAFIVSPPISTVTRDDIYLRYAENPTHWTSMRLAEAYGLSIVRVEAILRLGALKQKLTRSGKPLQTDLARGMDGMLKATTLVLPSPAARLSPREKLNSVSTKGIAPYLKLMNESDEGEVFSPEDAASLLGREPFAKIVQKMDNKATRAFVDSDKVPSEQAITQNLDQSPSMKSGFDFMFVDTSCSAVKEKTRRVPLIRDRSGVLRPASRLEQWKKNRAKPKFFM